MAIQSIGNLVDAENNGYYQFSTWRKSPTQGSAIGVWQDLSMSAGNPVPNYYAASPTIAIGLAQSTDGGIYHGGAAPAGKTKYLKDLMAMSVTAGVVPMELMLCDYLMYYPFMDMSVIGEQDTTTNIPLPRYPTGAGCQIMAVEVEPQSGVGNPQFYLTYTNSSGTTGRTTRLVACNTQVATGSIITSDKATNLCAGPFIPLQPGDTGVQSIQSIWMTGTGDVGLITLVIVKPLATMTIRGIDAPVERSFAIDFAVLPTIQPDAYLNFLCHPSATLAASAIHGTANFIWG